ncbi:MAG: hypothetical protein Q9184_005190 [Pyrenodesmia sp. 2 TL-2023]
MSAQMSSEIDRAITTIEEQHAMTRQHTGTQIASVMQRLEISHDRYRIEQSQNQESQRRYDQFLESLWFSDMNLRANDVPASYPGTFQWIFDTTTKRPWSSFTQWLKGSDCMYWVQGKAGSGKTTLMKFIANDPRTRDLLVQSSSNNKTLIATFYFWLSGSNLQRSLKGLLFSLSRQIMLENRSFFDSILTEMTVLTKRSIHDWSGKELQRLLMRSIDFFPGPICIFLDGLDEFDRGDDIDNLLDLIETLSSLGKVKLCVSSRPENHIVKRMSKYSRIRLQDLTAEDIRICIRNSLHQARTRCSPTVVDDKRIDNIVRVMTAKAEGVFLWVHYALSSLIRGMRNQDDFGELLDRIEQLPSGVHQLYSQMWNRNEDQQRYHNEAATYFSYGEFYPLSVFELLVAMDDTLQGDYLEDFKPHVATRLARKCQRLSNRIHTVCAGLLEVVPGDDSHRGIEGSNVNPVIRDADYLATDPITNEESSPVTLEFYYKSRIQFMHRTARDFLLETKEGHVISGESVDSLQIRFRNVIRARLTALLQGFGKFNARWVRGIFRAIGEFETEYETELLITTKRVLEHLSIPDDPSRYIGYRSFWSFLGDFECTAARYGCIQYIRNFILHENRLVSPYYRGQLLLHTSDTRSDSLRRQIAEVFRLFLPLICISSGEGILFFHCEGGRRVYQEAFALHYPLIADPFIAEGHTVVAQMTLKKLCNLTMNELKDLGAFGPQWSRAVLGELGVTKVAFSFDTPTLDGFCPSSEDSIYLGEALDNILLWDETSPHSLDSLTKVFEARRAEVHERSRLQNFRAWSYDNGWRVGDSRLKDHTLDPAEEVDESNWMEKGHFKKPNKDLDSQPANLEDMED